MEKESDFYRVPDIIADSDKAQDIADRSEHPVSDQLELLAAETLADYQRDPNEFLKVPDNVERLIRAQTWKALKEQGEAEKYYRTDQVGHA